MAHQNKKTSLWMSFYFHTKTEGIRTREGMSVIRSVNIRIANVPKATEMGAEEAARKQSTAGVQVPHSVPSTVTI